jgi:hypothetical protein
MSNIDSIRINELDPDMIQPSTATYKDPEQGGTKTVVIGKPGTGKCLAPGTKIVMYNGSVKTVENIKIGDLLMGDDSLPRKVLSTTQGTDVMYEIRQKNGESYTVNAPHILSLKDEQGKLLDISIVDFLKKPIEFRNKYYGYKVPVEFRKRKVESPYFMAYNSVLTEDMKINDKETRLEVLAGVVDNMGYYDEKEGVFILILGLETFTDDVIYIARSLGFSVEKKEYYRGRNRYFGCVISGDIERIPVKNFKNVLPTTKSSLLTEIDIIRIGNGSYYGFQLDGNHRFLLGDFTVTHNTTLIASLLYAKKHIIPVAMAVSGTEDSNHFYQTVLPSTFVFNNYDEEQIEKFIKRQKIAKDYLENPWAVIILDDCTDDPQIFRKPLQNGMYKRGRHWKMWYILSLQYGMDVRPVIRTNVDGVFILREPNMRNRRVMYENYASIIPSFELFCTMLDALTSDYTALYLHNSLSTNNWQDCVYWYKAKKIPKDFKFGCEEYWEFHFERYNPEYVDPIAV